VKWGLDTMTTLIFIYTRIPRNEWIHDTSEYNKKSPMSSSQKSLPRSILSQKKRNKKIEKNQNFVFL
jgi:hypothetical protein